MRKPTTDHIEGFFLGMKHALSLAEACKSGRFSRQSHAIRMELAKLRLENETYKAKASNKAQHA